MPETVDLDRWTNHLQGISQLRKVKDHHGAKATLWFFLVGILFIGTWMFFGMDVAGPILMGSLVLLIFLSTQNSLFSSSIKKKNQFESQSAAVERDLFQKIAAQHAPWIKVRFQAPRITEPVKSSGLIRGQLDFVSGSRCLTGCFASSVPFCAVHIEAGRIEQYRDSQKRLQNTRKVVFQGVFILFDCPSLPPGRVSLESDNLEVGGWLANEWRNVSDGKYVRMENVEFEKHFHVRADDREQAFRILTPHMMVSFVDLANQCAGAPLSLVIQNGLVMAVLPMKDSPFVLRTNEAVWKEDLERFQSVLNVVGGMVETLNASVAQREGVRA